MGRAREQVAHALERQSAELGLLLDLLLEHLEVSSVRTNETGLSVSLTADVVSNLLGLLLLGQLSDPVAGDQVLEHGEQRDDRERSHADRVRDPLELRVRVRDRRQSERR